MSSKKLYVGNLSFKFVDEDLHNLFSQYGRVISANVIFDRDTGRSKGFGFVEMDEADAQKAIEALDQTVISDRQLKVNEARPKEDRPRDDRRRGGFDSKPRGGGYGDSPRRFNS